MNNLKTFADKYPVIMVLIVFSLIIAFMWWLNQPVEVIYDRDSAPYNIDDDIEGGYLPRP